jgi:hypothetical protein
MIISNEAPAKASLLKPHTPLPLQQEVTME